MPINKNLSEGIKAGQVTAFLWGLSVQAAPIIKTKSEAEELFNYIYEIHGLKGIVLIFKIWSMIRFETGDIHCKYHEIDRRFVQWSQLNSSLNPPTWAHVAASLNDTEYDCTDELQSEISFGDGTTGGTLKPVHIACMFGNTKWVQKNHPGINLPGKDIQCPNNIFPPSLVPAKNDFNLEDLLINSIISASTNSLTEVVHYLCSWDHRVNPEANYSSRMYIDGFSSHVKLLMYCFLLPEQQKEEFKNTIFKDTELAGFAWTVNENENPKTNWAKFVNCYALHSSNPKIFKHTLEWIQLQKQAALRDSQYCLDLESLYCLQEYVLLKEEDGVASPKEIKFCLKSIAMLLNSSVKNYRKISQEDKKLIAQLQHNNHHAMSLPSPIKGVFSSYQDAFNYNNFQAIEMHGDKRLSAEWLVAQSSVLIDGIGQYNPYDLMKLQSSSSFYGRIKSWLTKEDDQLDSQIITSLNADYSLIFKAREWGDFRNQYQSLKNREPENILELEKKLQGLKKASPQSFGMIDQNITQCQNSIKVELIRELAQRISDDTYDCVIMNSLGDENLNCLEEGGFKNFLKNLFEVSKQYQEITQGQVTIEALKQGVRALCDKMKKLPIKPKNWDRFLRLMRHISDEKELMKDLKTEMELSLNEMQKHFVWTEKKTIYQLSLAQMKCDGVFSSFDKGCFEWVELKVQGQGYYRLENIENKLFFEGIGGLAGMSRKHFDMFLNSRIFKVAAGAHLNEVKKRILSSPEANKLRLYEVLYKTMENEAGTKKLTLEDDYVLSVDELNRLKSVDELSFHKILNIIFGKAFIQMKFDGTFGSRFKEVAQAYSSHWLDYVLMNRLPFDRRDTEPLFLKPLGISLETIPIVAGNIAPSDMCRLWKQSCQHNANDFRKEAIQRFKVFLLKRMALDVYGSAIDLCLRSPKYGDKALQEIYDFACRDRGIFSTGTWFTCLLITFKPKGAFSKSFAKVRSLKGSKADLVILMMSSISLTLGRFFSMPGGLPYIIIALGLMYFLMDSLLLLGLLSPLLIIVQGIMLYSVVNSSSFNDYMSNIARDLFGFSFNDFMSSMYSIAAPVMRPMVEFMYRMIHFVKSSMMEESSLLRPADFDSAAYLDGDDNKGIPPARCNHEGGVPYAYPKEKFQKIDSFSNDYEEDPENPIFDDLRL